MIFVRSGKKAEQSDCNKQAYGDTVHQREPKNIELASMDMSVRFNTMRPCQVFVVIIMVVIAVFMIVIVLTIMLIAFMIVLIVVLAVFMIVLIIMLIAFMIVLIVVLAVFMIVPAVLMVMLSTRLLYLAILHHLDLMRNVFNCMS